MKNNQKFAPKTRFAACAGRARLLTMALRAARRAPASGSVSIVHHSAGNFFQDEPMPGCQNRIHLKRCGFFRGKLRRAKLKTENHPRTKDAFAPNL
jgi:hypothetical protein